MNMASAYLAFSFVKKASVPGNQLGISLSYLPSYPLKEYLYCANIYRDDKYRTKYDLIDTIISEKDKRKQYNQKYNDLLLQEAKSLLKNRSEFLMIKN